jgi:hypothetical protein
VCRSWPQACIAPGFFDVKSSPLRSTIGSASMSPRSTTTGPSVAAPPRSTAVTELSAAPVLISSGSPSSAASTVCWVWGRCSPISGVRCSSRRSAASSSWIAAASD